MPVSKQRNYHQNGGMFFLIDGKPIPEYENMDSSELYTLFKKIMESATSIRMLSEFSLYGFVLEISMDPDGPIQIMRQTRNVRGEPTTPTRASKRQDAQKLTSFCLKIVGIDTGEETEKSKQYVSLDGKKTKNKALAKFEECDKEVTTTRYVWDRMTRHNCAEVVPDAGFGVNVTCIEFEELFKNFITTPHNASSYVIQWIITNFENIYLTVMEMASGCDTFSAYIERMERPTTQSIADESIKNASMEIIAYLIAMWIRTGIITTDGHSKNIMVNAATASVARVHVSFNIYLLDLGRIIYRIDIDAIRSRFTKLFAKDTPNKIALRAALHTHFNCKNPLPIKGDSKNDAQVKQVKLVGELITMLDLDFISTLDTLPFTGLNIDQVKRAFKSAILCDIVTNAADYDHNYPQCVTVLHRAFGIQFTNVSFLMDPFDTPDDDAVFGTILSCVNRLLIPCRPSEVPLSLRVVPVPATPRAFVENDVGNVNQVVPLTDKVGDFVKNGGVNAEVVPDDSESSHNVVAAVKRTSSSSDAAVGKQSSSSLSSSPSKRRNETSSLSPRKQAFFNEHNGGSRKNRRHKIRRGIKRSHSRSKHLRRSRNEKRRIRTTCRKYRRN